MKRTLFLTLSACALALALDSGVARAQTCPSPPLTLSSCSTSNSTTLAEVSGTYVCTQVGVDNTNTVSGAVVVATFHGDGTGTGTTANNNNGAGSTFKDFSTPNALSYCVNADGTGYIFPSGGSSCPLAAVFDDKSSGVFLEGRLIDTTEGNAEAIVCNHQ